MPLMGNKDFKFLNRSIPRVDAYDKVTGKARYAGDLEFAGMLFGGTLYSPVSYTHLCGHLCCTVFRYLFPRFRKLYCSHCDYFLLNLYFVECI